MLRRATVESGMTLANDPQGRITMSTSDAASSPSVARPADSHPAPSTPTQQSPPPHTPPQATAQDHAVAKSVRWRRPFAWIAGGAMLLALLYFGVPWLRTVLSTD